jgi:hypothetical protein
LSSQVVPLAFCTGGGQTPVAVLHAPAVWHWSAVHTTGLLPVHTPAWHVSGCVHALLSSQVVPLAFCTGGGQTPVVVSHVPAVWHWSAVHTTGLPPIHIPASHVSGCVHALLSSQVVPLAFCTGGGQTPVAVLHAPAVWHWSAVHTTGLLPVHTPAWHVSGCVHALLSSQVVPLAFCAGGGQTPVAVLHAPAVWHWSAVHTTGLLPVHTPFWQVSVWVHAFPSSQAVPLTLIGMLHVPSALQVPG